MIGPVLCFTSSAANKREQDQTDLAKEVDCPRRSRLLMGIQQKELKLALSIKWQTAIIFPFSLWLCSSLCIFVVWMESVSWSCACIQQMHDMRVKLLLGRLTSGVKHVLTALGYHV